MSLELVFVRVDVQSYVKPYSQEMKFYWIK